MLSFSTNITSRNWSSHPSSSGRSEGGKSSYPGLTNSALSVQCSAEGNFSGMLNLPALFDESQVEAWSSDKLSYSMQS
jgi:hypothetical protein